MSAFVCRRVSRVRVPVSAWRVRVAQRSAAAAGVRAHRHASSSAAAEAAEAAVERVPADFAPSEGSLAYRAQLPLLYRWIGPHNSRTAAYVTGERLFAAIEAQTARGAWPSVFAGKDDFHHWFMLCLLHVWMVLARLRLDAFRRGGSLLTDALFAIFWSDVERRMVALGLTNPLILSKNLNIYTRFYYGSCILVKGVLRS